MKKLNVHETKTHLSRYIPEILKGETILLCKRNVPFAEIRPLTQKRVEKRPFGLAQGKFEIGNEFFEPLDEKLTKAFQGSPFPLEKSGDE